MIHYKAITFVLQSKKFSNPRRRLDYARQEMLSEFCDYLVSAFLVWVAATRDRGTGECMG